MKCALLFCLLVPFLVTIVAKPTSSPKLVEAADPSINDVLSANSNNSSETHIFHPSETVHIKETPELKPPKPPGTKFVTLIDDIFQIPISILQSVAKLITHPFKHDDKPN